MQPESILDLRITITQLKDIQKAAKAADQAHIERVSVHIQECRRFLTALKQRERSLYRYLIGADTPWPVSEAASAPAQANEIERSRAITSHE